MTILPPAPRLAPAAFVVGWAIMGLLLAQPLGAQAPQEEPRGTPGAELRPQVALGGGVAGLGGSGLHGFAGLEGGILRGRFGLAAAGHLGTGNDFRSSLLAVGPAAEVAEVRSTSLAVWAGPAWYGERIDAGFDRRLRGLHGGASARRPMGRAALVAGASLWRGTLRGDGIEAPFPVTGLRFHLGLGL